jgi:glycogen synthase
LNEVVHITADFPDRYAAGKTGAVKSLIELTPELRHRVYSFNRVSGLSGVAPVAVEEGLTTLTYRALPYGILMRRGLRPLSEWILADLRGGGVRPSLIHAHKLTIDGLVSLPVAQALGCPLVLNVWGDSDQKIIQKKPGLRASFRAVADGAARILPATPWAADYVEAALGVARAKIEVLPVVSRVRPPLASLTTGAGFVSVLNLDSHRRKNIGALFAALGLLHGRGITAKLDIYGGGSERARRAVGRLIDKAGLRESVRIMGPVDHAVVQEVVSGYSAFVLPSLRETFGMVFVEALFAGVPILYPQRASLDGYFTDVTVGYRCQARDVQDIARGLELLLDREAELKRGIAQLHAEGFFRMFEDSHIAQRYLNIVKQVSAGPAEDRGDRT